MSKPLFWNNKDTLRLAYVNTPFIKEHTKRHQYKWHVAKVAQNEVMIQPRDDTHKLRAQLLT